MTWSGENIPGIGTPTAICAVMPKINDPTTGLVKMQVDATSLPSGALETALRGPASDAFHDLQDRIWGPVLANGVAQTGAKAAKIASFFVPGGFLVGAALEAGGRVGVGVTSAVSKGAMGGMVKECTDAIQTILMKANADSLAEAKASGSATYLSAKLCEQPVALNDIQALCIVEQLDPTNKQNILVRFKKEGIGAQQSSTSNRFPTLQLCTPLDERVLAIPPTVELEYDASQARWGDVHIVKKTKDGEGEEISKIRSLLTTLKSAATIPIQMGVECVAKRKADQRGALGLPTCGDFIIRRFFIVEEVVVGGTADPRVLVLLPPVYAQWPDDGDAASLIFPRTLTLAPGPRPPLHPVREGAAFLKSREAMQEANAQVYNAFDGTRRHVGKHRM